MNKLNLLLNKKRKLKMGNNNANPSCDQYSFNCVSGCCNSNYKCATTIEDCLYKYSDFESNSNYHFPNLRANDGVNETTNDGTAHNSTVAGQITNRNVSEAKNVAVTTEDL